MPSGACVIRREGARGVVWSVKFRDATGRQVKERLGPEPQWNRQRAERELGKRLDLVERERWAKPTEETFAVFVAEWRRIWLPSRNLKRSTTIDYENTLDRHALPFFGDLPLRRIGPEHIDGYVAAKRKQGLSPKTIRNHLNTLSLVFSTARRWKRIRENPLDEVDGPKLVDPETVILTEDEVAALLKAYRELAARTETGDEQWKASRYRGDEDLLFGHPFLGTPLDPAELTRTYVKAALKKAGITKPLQPWHGLRHTALTMDAVVGNPNAYVQAKAGHSQFSITERYVHAAQVLFPGAAERGEERIFAQVEESEEPPSVQQIQN